MFCRHTNRRVIVQAVYLAVCVCQIDSSCQHCCTCPYSDIAPEFLLVKRSVLTNGIDKK
jgi:hypothetical protein